MASILVCDDQRSICEMLDISMRKEGHKVETVNAGEAAKKKLSSANYEVLITDIKMPQTDGIEVLRFARQVSPETSVILIRTSSPHSISTTEEKGTSGSICNLSGINNSQKKIHRVKHHIN